MLRITIEDITTPGATPMVWDGLPPPASEQVAQARSGGSPEPALSLAVANARRATPPQSAGAPAPEVSDGGPAPALL